MSTFRRCRVPGGTYAFTLHLQQPGSALLTERIHALRAAYAATHRERPFETLAIVVLPDHLHAIWRLPPGDADFSTRWRLIKAGFSRTLPPGRRRATHRRKNEKGIWLRRFWEHRIRDEAELAACKRYVWSDPVRHGLVAAVPDWEHSSWHRDGDAPGLSDRIAGKIRGDFYPQYDPRHDLSYDPRHDPQYDPRHDPVRAFGDDEMDRSVRVSVGEAQPRQVRRAQRLPRPDPTQVRRQPRA